MHQLPRPIPRTPSAASNPTTNPERTNNGRERPLHRARSSQELMAYTDRGQQDSAGETARLQDKESKKLDQIVQNFFTKAALTVCSSRANLPKVETADGQTKVNRWFNILLDDSDVLYNDLLLWRRTSVADRRPPPLVIEVYIDTSYLAYNQALVLVDDDGGRWNVSEFLRNSAEQGQNQSQFGDRSSEVLLERWTFELGGADSYRAADLNQPLPNVYKHGIVAFRTLWAFVRNLPVCKLQKKLSRQTGNHQALKVRFRIRQGSSRASQDALYTPLCQSEQASDSFVGKHAIPSILCPAGALSMKAEYRRNCDFNVSDAEAFLSSRFLGQDLGAPHAPFGRSLPAAARSEQSRVQYGSLGSAEGEYRARLGAYGSLGTFHGDPDKRGSPVSELKQRVLDDESGYGYASSSRARPVPDPGLMRRPSVSLVSNPPFKAGSLASSPRPASGYGTSAGRYGETNFARIAGTSAGTSASKRISLNTLPQQALRAPSLPNETAIASSGSSSPKPAPVHRYSSSFAGRTKRFTSERSKTGESNASSERESSSSKEKSGQLTDLAAPGSPASGRSGDEDDIASFISQIESVKDLPSFRARPVSRDNTVNLSKYTNRRDPNMQLADEMSSSSLIQASVTPPSRRLSNVPGLSTSSSPSRMLAHTPHVRSRLSTHSIAEEINTSAGASGASGEGSESPRLPDVEEPEEDYEEPFIFAQDSV